MAFDSSGSRDGSRPPISLHPAFPAVVALWFAALLGLGSMVMPVTLIERIVEATGISALVPAASPPLGFTARTLIALVAAAAGAAIGIAIARRVARAHDGDRPSRAAKFAKGARRPIDVNEELGGEGVVNGFGLPINRRRALAIAEDERPSDFLYMAPLPGDDDGDARAFDEPAVTFAAPDEPLELSDAVEVAAEPDAPGEDDPIALTQECQPAPREPDTESRQEFAAPVKADAEPLPFSAPSLARRAPEPDALAAEPEPAPDAPEPQPFRGDWASAPLGELGLVQLVQRLGSSLERRREWLASEAAAPTPAAPPPPPLPPTGFEPAPADEAAQAMAAYFGKPATASAGDDAGAADDQPATPELPGPAPRSALPGAWLDDDDDDDLDAVPSFTLPLRKAVAPTIAFDEPDAPGGDAADTDESYSSLLEMRNPFAPKDNGFVRIDEPEADDDTVEPTVVFPGQREAASTEQPPLRAFDPPAGPAARSPAAPADADAALRSALATLQRMSGTA